MKLFQIVCAFLLSALVLTANAMTIEEVESTLAAKFNNSKVHDVRPSPIDGLYEVTLSGAQVIYFSATNKALVFGCLLYTSPSPRDRG